MTVRLDGIWRPEPHPHREGDWLVVRYYDDGKRHVREVHTSATDATRPLPYPTEDAAQVACDLLNPAPLPMPGGELGEAQLQWLQRLADAPEGRMERAIHRTLLGLEHRGLAESKAEPGRRGMDRWTITEEGRAELERHRKEGMD
jgi:hypothetical protein